MPKSNGFNQISVVATTGALIDILTVLGIIALLIIIGFFIFCFFYNYKCHKAPFWSNFRTNSGTARAGLFNSAQNSAQQTARLPDSSVPDDPSVFSFNSTAAVVNCNEATESNWYSSDPGTPRGFFSKKIKEKTSPTPNYGLKGSKSFPIC